jgi:hypothetical protein
MAIKIEKVRDQCNMEVLLGERRNNGHCVVYTPSRHGIWCLTTTEMKEDSIEELREKEIALKIDIDF